MKRLGIQGYAVSPHKSATELRSAVQVALQSKAVKPQEPPAQTLSRIMLWASFGMGGYLLLAGFNVGVRSLRPNRNASPDFRDDKTPLELFLAGVRGWEAGLRH